MAKIVNVILGSILTQVDKLLSFPRPSNKTKRGDELRKSTQNIS